MYTKPSYFKPIACVIYALTLLGLLLPLLASALGGWVGRYERTDLVHGTG